MKTKKAQTATRAGGGAKKTWAKCRVLAVRFAVVALLVVVALMVLKLVPQQTPVKQNPGFVDVIFGSRSVVTAVRALIIFGSTYAALSVLALIWNQQWLTGFAGAQTGKIERSVSGLAEERDRLAIQLVESEETIQALEDSLGNALTELEYMSEAHEALSEALDMARAGRA